MATKDRATLLSDLSTYFPDNNTKDITPEDLRNQQTDVIDSLVSIIDGGVRENINSNTIITNQSVLFCQSALQLTFPAASSRLIYVKAQSGVVTLVGSTLPTMPSGTAQVFGYNGTAWEDI